MTHHGGSATLMLAASMNTEELTARTFFAATGVEMNKVKMEILDTELAYIAHEM